MDILNLLKKTGAILEGDFTLASGLHSNIYIQCVRLLQFPNLARDLSIELAKKLKKYNPTVVMSPAIGAIIFGYEVAEYLQIPFCFAEKVDENRNYALKREFKISPSDRVLIVEDVITTGGTVAKLIDIIYPAKCVGIGCIVNRVMPKIDIVEKVGIISLIDLKIKEYKE